MKARLFGLAFALAAFSAQAQFGPASAPTEQSRHDPARTQEMRELICRQQAERDMAKPVQTPSGATRAWEFERAQRIKLCLTKAAEPNEAELQTHRHYRAKDGHEVHSPAKSAHDQVPAGASAKCRDGTYSFSQHRRGTCSHHGGVAVWM
jgi:hypothetical protein